MFVIPRGATQSFTISDLVDENGDAIDLTLYRVYVTVRLHDAIVFTKKSANVTGGGPEQVELVAPGSFRVKFTATDTQREPMIGTIDAWLVRVSSGDQTRVLDPQPFEITESMTRDFTA